ncbi:tape measure protein [Escherichia coli]|nr:tape measure protein [Escherichia coli]
MAKDGYRTMQNGGRQSAAASREMRRALAEVTDQINTAKSSALNMAGAFAGAFATGHLISLADEWNSVNARLKQASQSSDDFQVSQRELMAISQRTGTAFSDNASLFARSAASMREYGYSSEEVLKVTEAISTGLKLSGASTAEASSVITQFSQALAQGVLRGEEFNSVNESGDRVIRALAAGMGVARKDLKAMADNGKLTADKVVPALISQLGALRDEYAAMPDTVSSSATKVENAFMAWVGGANEASGVTKTLSGGLNGLAGNIDTVATAAGALVAVGVARYFGNMASSAGSATAGLITAARNEVALAEAQLRGTQIATARARAAVYRAQQAVVAARGTERQAAAEAKLTAAQASLTRNIAARTAAQTTLNTVTSVGSRLLSGALGLVGGVPGLVMLGATAWYTMYQNQEQARESARQYAATIDEIRQKTSAMSLPEASDNEEKTRQALDEQNRLIDEQKSKIKSLQEKIAGYQYVLANPGWTTDNGFMINHMTSVKTVTEGLTDIRQVETTARYLGAGLYWIAASINIKPGHDYYFYIRSVNTVGKSAFVEAVGQPSDDASGYLDFFKGEIGKTHLAQELWTQIDNGQLAPDLAEIRTSITDVSNEITQTVNKKLEDQSAAIQQIQKVQVDTNNNLNSMWAVKLQQMQDGRLYIAGIGAGIENTPAGMQSQVLLAADRIAMINPANGNTKPMFVGQGDQIFMNDVFLKRLTAPTITSGGNPPAFSLTPDGRLTAKNADISGSVNANAGTLNNVTINENCRVLGKLSANQIEGDLVKTVGKAFPRDSRAPERWPSGTITVRVYDDQPFDRQIVIPTVAFRGAKHERENNDIYSSCRLIVKKNGAEIYNRTALDNTLVYTGVIDMPAGRGHMTLEFSVSAWLVNDW